MIFLASLLILSFAVWGVGDMVGVISNPDEIASISDTKITQRDFQKQFRREMQNIRSRLGPIDAEQARNLGIANATVKGLIDRRLLDLQAKDMSLLISDDQILRKIRQEPAFRNKGGEFDETVFRTTLANNGLNEATYVASLRGDTQRDYVTGIITAGAVAPPQLTGILFRYQNESRVAEVIRIKRKPFGRIDGPTEKQLQLYLDTNPKMFMAPEFRRLTVLHLDPAVMAKELSPSEDRIREEYENRLSSLLEPEERRLEHLVVKEQRTARKAHAALSSGQTFKAVAKKYIRSPSQDTSLGFVKQKDLLPTLAKIVFALPVNKLSKPTKSPLGWHILRVTTIKPGREPKLKEVREKIANELATELALDDLVKLSYKIEDTLAGGASIEGVAREIGHRITQTQFMDGSRKLASGSKASGIPDDPLFIRTAFSVGKGVTSDLVETSDGGFFMVRVDQIKDPKKQTLGKVRNEVERAWKFSKQNERAKATAQQVSQKAKRGLPLAKIAKPMGLIVQTSKPISRLSASANSLVPRSLMKDFFTAKPGEILMGQTLDGYAIARVQNVLAAPSGRPNSDFKRLQNSLSAAISKDVLQQYTMALRQQYSVSINQAALDAYFADRK